MYSSNIHTLISYTQHRCNPAPHKNFTHFPHFRPRGKQKRTKKENQHSTCTPLGVSYTKNAVTRRGSRISCSPMRVFTPTLPIICEKSPVTPGSVPPRHHNITTLLSIRHTFIIPKHHITTHRPRNHSHRFLSLRSNPAPGPCKDWTL